MFFFVLSVSELLMGELDSSSLLSLLPTEKSRVSFPLVQISPPRTENGCLRGSVTAHLCLLVHGELVHRNQPGQRQWSPQERPAGYG